MVKVSIIIMMAIYMMVNILMDMSMEKVSIIIMMEVNMKDNIKMVKDIVKEY